MTDPARLAYTLRLTAEQDRQLGRVTAALGAKLGRRRLDRAAVLLALIEAADANPAIRAAVAEALVVPGSG